MVKVTGLQLSEDKDRYYVLDNYSDAKDGIVGEVIMQYYQGYIALSHIDIYKEFRGLGYGKQIIKFLFSRTHPEGIVGESLKTSTKFWQNCINTFGGYSTKEGRMFGNTAFAFVIGTDKELDPALLQKLLQLCAKY